jgi:hypothetical protein
MQPPLLSSFPTVATRGARRCCTRAQPMTARPAHPAPARVGEWSLDLCLGESLSSGSCLAWLDIFEARGLATVLTDPNNSAVDPGTNVADVRPRANARSRSARRSAALTSRTSPRRRSSRHAQSTRRSSHTERRCGSSSTRSKFCSSAKVRCLRCLLLWPFRNALGREVPWRNH